MSGEPIRIDPISQPQAEAEEAALEVGEAPEERRGEQMSAANHSQFPRRKDVPSILRCRPRCHLQVFLH